MSVVIETTVGDITVDLFSSDRPRACLNFLKLCKIKYYNFSLFHTISRGFIAQTGDPSGSRSGGESIYGVLDGPKKRFFEGENEPRIKHTKMGLISFVGNEDRMIGSQFFFTLGEDLTYLDENHCVFGEVVEGFDILEIINEVICDSDDRPYQDVRITHTVILDDPFPDPKRLVVPSRSPSPSAERLKGGRIAPDEEIDDMEGKTREEVTEMQAEREAKARATILEMVGDLPDADMAPPENVLFVCKLNPVTTDDDLEIIFSRFGKIKSCEVIRDKKTGDSLQYAFIEFEDKTTCENAYFKMDNVLIDDRRIHVDFSQSVSKVKWRGKGRGVTHIDEKGNKSKRADSDIGKGNYSHKVNNSSCRNHDDNSSRRTLRDLDTRKDQYYKESSNTERSSTPKRKTPNDISDYPRNSRRSDDRFKKRRMESPSSPTRRRSSRSPKMSSDKNRPFEKEKYISKTNRNKSVSPKRRRDDYSSSSKDKRMSEKYSSSKNKRSETPQRGRDSSSYRRNQHERGSKRIARSPSPPRDSSSKNGKYEKHRAMSRNTHNTTTKYNSKRKEVTDSEESESENDVPRHKKTEESPREKRKNKLASVGGKKEKMSKKSSSDSEPERKRRKDKKKITDSSSEDKKNESKREKYRKKKKVKSDSSDYPSGSDEVKSKSKSKQSFKKNRQDSSSDSYREGKIKKRRKHVSESD